MNAMRHWVSQDWRSALQSSAEVELPVRLVTNPRGNLGPARVSEPVAAALGALSAL